MSEGGGFKQALTMFKRLGTRDKLKVIISVVFTIFWLFAAIFLMIYSVVNAKVFPELGLDPRITSVIGALIGALSPWVYSATRASIEMALRPVARMVLERAHIMPHEEFISKFKDDPRFKNAFSEIRGVKIGIIEEFPGGLKNASEILCDIVDARRFYIPEVLRLMIEPFWEPLKQLAREEGIATWYQLKARVKSWSPERMVLEGVSYLDAFIFHYAPDTLLGKKTLRDILWPLVMRNGKLIPLEFSVFPNHLGVQALLITKDGAFLITRRSIEVAVAKRAYAPPVEGTVNLPWSGGQRTLKELISNEVFYELGLRSDEYEAYLISLARGTYVMGRPSAFILLLARITSDELRRRVPVDKWESAGFKFEHLGLSVESIDDLADKKVVKKLDGLLSRYVKEYSAPTLIFSLGKLIDALKELIASPCT